MNKPTELEPIRESTRWKAILAGMLDAVVATDGYGNIRYANAACEPTFGYRPNELIGRNIRLLMPEPYRGEHDSYLAKYRATGETNILGATREFPLVTKDGRDIQCELSVSCIESDGEAETLYCGSFRDVTERNEALLALQASERRFHAIFDQEYQFVGLLEPDGTVIESNRASLDALGAKREDVIGKNFVDGPWWADSPEAQERIREAIRAAASGAFVRFETSYKTRRGPVVDIDFSLKPVRDEEGRVVLLLPEGRDISDVKRSQRREVAMMKAFAEIGESASLLAHEIKNPITAVNSALRAVARELGEDDQLVLQDLVERMQRLEGLMRRTLSLTRPIELSPELKTPGELFESAQQALAPLLEQQRVQLEVDAPEIEALSVDPQLMDNVLTNLIKNAVDAIEEDGRIRLQAAALDDRVVLRVDDDGPGIPENLMATVFRPFVSTKGTGTGLGLAITRRIVEAHGGTIEAGRGQLGGASFEIVLPRDHEP